MSYLLTIDFLWVATVQNAHGRSKMPNAPRKKSVDNNDRIERQRIARFQKKVFTWYSRSGRHDLPWRKNPTAYRVWVSEVMLQQTQVSRVLEKYSEWMKKFPTLSRLAQATPREVISTWVGLGYNRRAFSLLRAAQQIQKNYAGVMPREVEKLQQLPGIGFYTARAITIFAYNADDTCIDTNIRRVLLYEFYRGREVSEKNMQTLAASVLPAGKSREWHSALMDYGALVLTARKTGIHATSVQPSFKGSVRQARGAIVKYLNSRKHATADEIQKATGAAGGRLQQALYDLESDRLILKHGSLYSLPNVFEEIS